MPSDKPIGLEPWVRVVKAGRALSAAMTALLCTTWAVVGAYFAIQAPAVVVEETQYEGCCSYECFGRMVGLL